MPPSSPVLLDTVSKRIKEFGDCTEFTIGRDQNCSYDITSQYVSRTQCVIKKHSNNEWAVYDQSTYKSTLINGSRIEGEYKVLKDNDKLSFQYYKDLELVFYSCQDNINNQLKRKASDIIDDSFCVLSPSKTVKSNDHCTETQVLNTPNFKLCSKLAESSKKSAPLFVAENEALKQRLREDQSTIEYLKMQIEDLKETLKESEIEQERLVQEFANKQLNFADKHSSDFDSDKMSMLDQDIDMNQALDLDLEPVFELPNDELDIDLEKHSDHEFMNDCFIENSDGRVDLKGIFETVDKIYLEKEIETLKKHVDDKDHLLSESYTDKENFKSKVTEVLEHELLCGVCSEILYQAVTLNCRHTFCKQCITEWKKKKKECPVCRTAIKIEVNPLVIDSFIDKAIEMLGGEYKAKRDELKAERAVKAVPPKKTKEKKGRRNVRSRRSRAVITISNDSPVVQIQFPQQRGIIDLTSPIRPPPIINCLP